jgi:dinuclear metal center YbgI/SA1388 family protein
MIDATPNELTSTSDGTGNTLPTLLAITQYVNELLDVRNVPDYSNALNGLQLANQGPIVKIAAAVDFSSQTIGLAIEAGANLMVVHHGMFWGGLQRLQGPAYSRLKALIDNDVAVYAAHLPLDKHAGLGNNTLLASALGLVPSGEFARYKTIFIGVRGEGEISTVDLFERARLFARAHGGDARTTPIADGQVTRSWAICTGGGASLETLHEAAATGIDTLIVGEGPHYTAVEANELGITVIYAGHYATETLGVRALSAHLSEKFAVPWTFVEAPTGL